MLKINQITKNMRGQVLFTTDKLTANKGDVIGVVGDNGVGKSTLLSMLTGDDTDYTGQITASSQPFLVPQIFDVTTAQRQSGGEIEIQALRQALDRNPPVLLLDEPTANLDVAHQDWLINRLKRYRGILIIVSHDEYLLEALVNWVWALKDNKLQAYHMDYVRYRATVEQIEVTEQQQYRAARQQAKKLHDEAQKLVQRGNRVKRQNNTLKGDTVQAQLTSNAKILNKESNRLAEIEKPQQKQTLKLQHQANVRSTQVLVNVVGIPVKSADDKILVDEVTLKVQGRDKYIIHGENGIGKSTLLQMLVKQANQHVMTKVGYFSQQLDQLENQATVIDNVLQDSNESEQIARDFLGAMGIRGEMYHQNVASLSGGERVRVSLVRTLLSGANLLILDEPTNYLDISALQALQVFLQQFTGAVILVSHHRQFTQALAWRKYVIDNQALKPI
ncbi:ABC-F family ATP-binding cassette domain-containing protein [Weissella diestrammenae]|uniref:ABC-F family ATP-binding cassette domain-containing protein n=1 Tax=Weissella diestrammenae TaxID=1162633 RepID=A0A7G9T3V8_9LACO|nr:ATP-binding cassette domain-containing protein [Weissella diestrammenae]MCM0582107.1 ABC-F family ATP-binding cassette domain-containing protein [Weissella diestrammenae]QNN74783.1 ABC-F family ATP-binding cassette domain-containing protein [Weissella diestrammenae]